jgi:hypothetical protein
MSVPVGWPQVLNFFATPLVVRANAVLQRQTEGLRAEAVETWERERQTARQQDPPRSAVPSRLFAGFWYQPGTWTCARYGVARAEANDRGTSGEQRL